MLTLSTAIDLASKLYGLTADDLSAKYSLKDLASLRAELGIPAPVKASDRRKASVVDAILRESAAITAAISRFNSKAFKTPRASEPYDDRLTWLKEAVLSVTPENMAEQVASIAGSWLAYEQHHYSESTRVKNLTKAQRALDSSVAAKDETYKAASIQVMRLLRGANKATAEAMRQGYKKDVAERARNRDTPDSELMIKAVNTLKALSTQTAFDAIDARDVILCILLITGRRPSEVLSYQSDFKAIGDRAISFTGLAKAKGSAVEKAQKPIVFQVPCSALWLIHAIKLLDANGYRAKTHSEVNKAYSTMLSRRVKTWASEDKKAYDLRKLWGSYQLARYYDRANPIDESYWLAELLGHDKEDSGTVNSYKAYIPVWSDEALAL